MKKRALFLAALSVGMLLTACGNNPAESSTSTTSSDATAEILAARKKALAGFITNIGANNVTMSVSGTSTSYKRYYLGADAFVAESADSSEVQQAGILVNGDQGFFYFTIEDGAVALSSCAGLGNDITNYFIVPSMLANDDFIPYYNLEGQGYVYQFDTKKMIQDVRYLYYICNLLGISGQYYTYTSSLTLTLNEDGSEGKLKLTLKNGGQTVTQIATFSNFGTTDVKAVSDYLKNPQVIEAPTSFSESSQTAIEQLFGENAEDVIFPTGLATATFGDSPMTNDNNQLVAVEWQNYGEDLRKPYAKLLTAAGYEYGGSQESESDGLTHYIYQKEIEAQKAEGRQGAKYIVCDLSYGSSAKEFTAIFYNGTLGYKETYTTIADANKTGFAYMNSVMAYDIPELPATSDLKGDITFTDNSANSDYSYYFVVSLNFATKEIAMSYAEDYLEELATYHYVDSGETTFEKDGGVIYAAPNVSNATALISVSVVQSTDGWMFGLIAIGQ